MTVSNKLCFCVPFLFDICVPTRTIPVLEGTAKLNPAYEVPQLISCPSVALCSHQLQDTFTAHSISFLRRWLPIRSRFTGSGYKLSHLNNQILTVCCPVIQITADVSCCNFTLSEGSYRHSSSMVTFNIIRIMELLLMALLMDPESRKVQIEYTNLFSSKQSMSPPPLFHSIRLKIRLNNFSRLSSLVTWRSNMARTFARTMSITCLRKYTTICSFSWSIERNEE